METMDALKIVDPPSGISGRAFLHAEYGALYVDAKVLSKYFSVRL